MGCNCVYCFNLILAEPNINSNLIIFFVLFGRKSYGEQPSDAVGTFSHKMHQIKKQIQAERMVSVKVCFFFYKYNI